MSNNTGNTVLALLAGAVVGAGIGILFAPDKGSRTREKIKGGYDDAKTDLKHKLENATNSFKRKFSNAKYDLEDTYEDLVSNLNPFILKNSLSLISCSTSVSFILFISI